MNRPSKIWDLPDPSQHPLIWNNHGQYVFSSPGHYLLYIKDKDNCMSVNEITLSLEESCDPLLEIPNVFTPNGDGVNDGLKIKKQRKTRKRGQTIRLHYRA